MFPKNFYKTLSLLALAGYSWLAVNLIRGGNDPSGTTLCLFKRLTGIACPSCGVTRSMLALLHGDARIAFHTNPLGVVLLPLLCILPLWISSDFIRSQSSLFRVSERAGQIFMKYRWAAVTGITLLIANWGWNIFKTL
jgi:hypothetical protein